MNLKKQLNTSGYTLLEVIASTIILSVILLSFYALIISTMKTTKTSETIIDYTYLAQIEMENLYEKSTTPSNSKIENVKTNIQSLGFTYSHDENGYSIFKKNVLNQNSYILLKIKNHDEYDNLYNVIIKIYDQNKNILKSQIETILSWGDE